MAGNTLRINPTGSTMTEDRPIRDAMVFVASEIFGSHDFRNSVRPTSGDVDAKQVVADAVMAKLEVLHQQALAIHDAIPGVATN